MAQQRDLGFDPACAGKSGKPLGTHDAVTRNNDRYRVSPTRLPYRLRRHAKPLCYVAISAGMAERNRGHRSAYVTLKYGTFYAQGQIKGFTRARRIGRKLCRCLVQQIGAIINADTAPFKRHNCAILLDKGQITKGCRNGALVHILQGEGLRPKAQSKSYLLKLRDQACTALTAASQRAQTPGWLWVPTSGKTFQHRSHFSPSALAKTTATPTVSGIRNAS